jgi:hypothetical protein
MDVFLVIVILRNVYLLVHEYAIHCACKGTLQSTVLASSVCKYGLYKLAPHTSTDS